MRLGCKSGLLDWIMKKVGMPPAAGKPHWLEGVRSMIGMGQGMWHREDPDEYVRRLREGWN